MMMMMLIPSRNSSNQGGSSGILLGAVTLLGLMLSRLLQISRGLSLSEVGVADLEFIQLQYWAASASCFGVLIFLHIILQREDNSVSAVGSYSYGKTKVSLSCITLYAGVCCSAFSAKSYFGWQMALMLFWVVIYGLAAAKLIQSILRTSPACAPIGEALSATSGLVIYFGDMLAHTVQRVLDFVFSESFKSMSLCTYWIALIYASVTRFYDISKNSKIERILLRKYYHLMAVSMFVPSLIIHVISGQKKPEFLDLAFGAALAVFLILEIIRVWKNWSLGQLVYQFMNAFTDHRDSEILIIGHFSLLLGCALPTWLSSGFKDQPLAPFAGILSLGIGDTMASMVGHKYGVLRWSKTGKKIIEGTAAGITSILFACCLLLPLLATTGYIFTQHWFSLRVAVTVSELLEAYTAQLDNAHLYLLFSTATSVYNVIALYLKTNLHQTNRWPTPISREYS